MNIFFWITFFRVLLLGVRSSFLALRPIALKIGLLDVRAFPSQKKAKRKSKIVQSGIEPGEVDPARCEQEQSMATTDVTTTSSFGRVCPSSLNVVSAVR